MATRQEMVCAINLIRHIARSNGHIDSLVKVLDGTIFLVDDEDITLSFADKKLAIERTRAFLEGLTDRIKTVITKADSVFLDNGIVDVSLRATKTTDYWKRLEIDGDAGNVNSGCKQSHELINASSKDADLEAIATNLKTITLKSGIVEPDPWQLFPLEINHANILHDILDALSYELQGFNSYTGQLHGLTNEQRDKLFSNRIFTANVYLSHLPNNADRQELGTVLSYIETELPKAKDEIQISKIGKYIDQNLPKLIMVRRWWAL